MSGLIIILLYACKLAFLALASSACVRIIEFSPKNEARKAYFHLHKRIILMPPIYERCLWPKGIIVNNAYTKFWGANKVLYGQFENGE